MERDLSLIEAKRAQDPARLEPTIEGKRVIVLSDHNLITRAIELALDGSMKLDLLSPAPDLLEASGGRRLKIPGCDLIVVAVSSPSTEPVVALVRSSLVDRIGQVPLLIISDRPFAAVPEAKISHLRYPFDPIRLRKRVCQILLDAETGCTRPERKEPEYGL